jgi:hypothetical protein
LKKDKNLREKIINNLYKQTEFKSKNQDQDQELDEELEDEEEGGEEETAAKHMSTPRSLNNDLLNPLSSSLPSLGLFNSPNSPFPSSNNNNAAFEAFKKMCAMYAMNGKDCLTSSQNQSLNSNDDDDDDDDIDDEDNNINQNQEIVQDGDNDDSIMEQDDEPTDACYRKNTITQENVNLYENDSKINDQNEQDNHRHYFKKMNVVRNLTKNKSTFNNNNNNTSNLDEQKDTTTAHLQYRSFHHPYTKSPPNNNNTKSKNLSLIESAVVNRNNKTKQSNSTKQDRSFSSHLSSLSDNLISRSPSSSASSTVSSTSSSSSLVSCSLSSPPFIEDSPTSPPSSSSSKTTSFFNYNNRNRKKCRKHIKKLEGTINHNNTATIDDNDEDDDSQTFIDEEGPLEDDLIEEDPLEQDANVNTTAYDDDNDGDEDNENDDIEIIDETVKKHSNHVYRFQTKNRLIKPKIITNDDVNCSSSVHSMANRDYKFQSMSAPRLDVFNPNNPNNTNSNSLAAGAFKIASSRTSGSSTTVSCSFTTKQKLKSLVQMRLQRSLDGDKNPCPPLKQQKQQQQQQFKALKGNTSQDYPLTTKLLTTTDEPLKRKTLMDTNPFTSTPSLATIDNTTTTTTTTNNNNNNNKQFRSNNQTINNSNISTIDLQKMNENLSFQRAIMMYLVNNLTYLNSSNPPNNLNINQLLANYLGNNKSQLIGSIPKENSINTTTSAKISPSNDPPIVTLKSKILKNVKYEEVDLLRRTSSEPNLKMRSALRNTVMKRRNQNKPYPKPGESALQQTTSSNTKRTEVLIKPHPPKSVIPSVDNSLSDLQQQQQQQQSQTKLLLRKKLTKQQNPASQSLSDLNKNETNCDSQQQQQQQQQIVNPHLRFTPLLIDSLNPYILEQVSKLHQVNPYKSEKLFHNVDPIQRSTSNYTATNSNNNNKRSLSTKIAEVESSSKSSKDINNNNNNNCDGGGGIDWINKMNNNSQNSQRTINNNNNNQENNLIINSTKKNNDNNLNAVNNKTNSYSGLALNNKPLFGHAVHVEDDNERALTKELQVEALKNKYSDQFNNKNKSCETSEYNPFFNSSKKKQQLLKHVS